MDIDTLTTAAVRLGITLTDHNEGTPRYEQWADRVEGCVAYERRHDCDLYVLLDMVTDASSHA